MGTKTKDQPGRSRKNTTEESEMHMQRKMGNATEMYFCKKKGRRLAEKGERTS